jgi:predicted SprT family Zn-dependent metalloprotease
MTKLQRTYRYYNRKYFGNSLPSDTPVAWDKMSIYGYITTEDEIYINRAYRQNDAVWRLTLLHEMVHLALSPYRGHGKPFQRMMVSLAKAGAMRHLW